VRKLLLTALIIFGLSALFGSSQGWAAPAPKAEPAPYEDYKLRPGDVLSISVLGYDEFVPPANASGPPGFLVRPDGRFSFPLIGEVAVQELTVGELTEQLRLRLSEYLIDPKLTVNLARLGGTRIYVLGEVVRPGSYEIEKAHNLLDAVTAAGGPTKDGAKRNVYIVHRREPDKFQKVNLLAILKKGDMSQNVALSEGDAVFLTSNGRINFASDILPFITATYYVDYIGNRK
jgi:polysaccharide export outer membrane protein